MTLSLASIKLRINTGLGLRIINTMMRTSLTLKNTS